MARFLIKRVFYILIVLLIVSTLIFLLYRTMPGDIAVQFMAGLEGDFTPEQWQEQIDTINRMLGLDRPMWYQFFAWMREMFLGNFGYTFPGRIPVVEAVRTPMINTVIMNIMVMIIVFAITIPVGIRAAIKRGKLFDNGTLFFTTIGFSFPNFLFGLLLIIIFSVFLGWLPTGGMQNPMSPIWMADGTWTTWDWILDRARYMALPMLTLVLVGMAGLVRFIRSAMIDALSQDFVRTARSKGLAEKTVIYSHAFRNALVPVVTIMAMFFIGIFGGSMVVERVFNWNGMGVLMLDALGSRDIATLKALSVFYSLVAFIGLLLLDIVYVLIDPRIRFE